MIIIYGIPACNTMKKAFEYLKNQGLTYEFHDYKKKGISPETLSIFLEKLGPASVLNKNGSTYKQLEDATKNNLENPDALFEFLSQKTSAIKRPILVDGEKIIAGFDEAKLAAWLKS
ncbi:Spx/MgsR family RNA polymerase-binding regulatory protein [Cytophagaceae bacterium 50C-KIRBA]|uniref:Spx/MgsR family RNA polymerase-binding regulatory protein n=1 Tax=Aquirufa beregesia TaxID=2516556 RepID=A0ABX0F0R9_9BACT|nr:Spx/MgsR family RNA polymerase-binding regulatory protein [Aquirufa beregesia]NGZ45367.1 Spx/MgsR family RNA polymerase-binding regulatory protein [Aquirufa beregesia]